MAETFTLKRRVWSQNEQRRVHWSRQRKERDYWLLLLQQQLVRSHGAVRLPPPIVKATVSITAYRCPLCKDKANLIGGCKELVDAMVLCGLMKDDSDEWCDITYRQVKCRKAEERTEVTVEWEDLF